jgi:site-specific recombinase XerD
MPLAATNPRIYDVPRSALSDEIRAFLTDRQARGLRPGTITFYAQKLDLLARYLADRGVTTIEAITARGLRAFLLHLGEGHAPGGV